MRAIVSFLLVAYLLLMWILGRCYGEGPVVPDEREVEEGIWITEELRQDGKKALRAAFHVKADPHAVYRTLRDVERFPEFMPESKRVEILKRGEHFQIVAFSGNRGLFSADIVMKRILDDTKRRIDWFLLEGPPRELSGYWQVGGEKKEDGIVVTYSNYLDAGLLVPDFLVRSLLREDIREMVVSIRKRVEGNTSWQPSEYRGDERKDP